MRERERVGGRESIVSLLLAWQRSASLYWENSIASWVITASSNTYTGHRICSRFCSKLITVLVPPFLAAWWVTLRGRCRLLLASQWKLSANLRQSLFCDTISRSRRWKQSLCTSMFAKRKIITWNLKIILFSCPGLAVELTSNSQRTTYFERHFFLKRTK